MEDLTTAVGKSFEYNVFLGLLVVLVAAALIFLVRAWMQERKAVDRKNQQIIDVQKEYHNQSLATQEQMIKAINNNTAVTHSLEKVVEGVANQMAAINQTLMK